MNDNLMILPATKNENIRLIRFPEDFEQHEAYRHVTGLIAKAEEQTDSTGKIYSICWKKEALKALISY